jgi:RimJ/RimL family protein N-acetyltransferase
MTTILETPRLRLREYTHGDLDDLAAMFADDELMRYYSHPKSRDESLAWIEWNLELYEQRGFGLWVMESLETSEFVGDCGLTPQTIDGATDIEVGWHTRREYWNQGLATEAASACRDHAFGDLGLQRLISIIHPDNIASRRVAEKLGMEVERSVPNDSSPKVIYAMGRP